MSQAASTATQAAAAADGDLTDAAKVFKTIHPLEYHRAFLREGVRSGDGRLPDEFRAASVTRGSLASTCDASSLVKLGQTTNVICGIKSELAVEPKSGVVMLQVRVPALSSERAATTSGGFSAREKRQQELTQLVNDVVQRCIDTDVLIIERGRVVWVLYVDLYVLEDDGAAEDACLLAAMAALDGLHLPRVHVDEENEEVKLTVTNEQAAEGRDRYSYDAVRLLQKCAFASSFVQMRVGDAHDADGQYVLLADPTQQEEQLAETKCTFVYDEHGQLLASTRLGGTHLTERDTKRAMAQSKLRAEQLRRHLAMPAQPTKE